MELILIGVCVILLFAWISSEMNNYKQRRRNEIYQQAFMLARQPSYHSPTPLPRREKGNRQNQKSSSSDIWLILFIFLAFLFVIVVSTVTDNDPQSVQQEQTVFSDSNF